MALIVVRTRVIICLMFLLSVSSFADARSAFAQSSAVTPVLTSALATSIPFASITVAGKGFTSGGLVYIALFDQWGKALQETRWTTASPAVYGLNGSMDPALGYAEGGRINEEFAQFRATIYGPHGSQDPAQGYSPGSGLVEITEAVYGANGSQDPAQGYVPGSANALAANPCDQALMVRAFDRQAAAWSNLVDVASGC